MIIQNVYGCINNKDRERRRRYLSPIVGHGENKLDFIKYIVKNFQSRRSSLQRKNYKYLTEIKRKAKLRIKRPIS